MTAARVEEMRVGPDAAGAAERGESAAVRRWRRLRRNPGFWVGAVVLAVLAFVSVAPGLVAPYGPTALDILSRLKPPSWAHPFGTDEVGRDVFSRVLHGTRLSLGVAVCVAVIGALVGVVVGAVSGFVGGWLDNLVTRVGEVFLAFPTFILAMAVASVAGRGLASLALSLVVVWWPSYARLVRGMVMAVKERQHVESARALGASESRILFKHTMPFVAEEVIVRVTVDIGYALVAVTALSFLGLGARSPTPEWGLLISDARTYFASAWWYMLFPGLAVVVSTIAFSLVGDAIADTLRK